MGLRDEELVDEVGTAFLARVESSLRVSDAHQGLITCPGCGERIEHRMHRRRGTTIRCADCGWSVAWEAYHKSYRKKQLVAGGMEPFFREFQARYPLARGYQEKMLLIDALIHRFHGELAGSPGRSGAVNLIGGTWEEVLGFLDRLAQGPGSTPGLAENRAAWQELRAGK
jgi:predicted RNA-binding Zn-ribbon protein involved in translation (DUF1610 family)